MDVAWPDMAVPQDHVQRDKLYNTASLSRSVLVVRFGTGMRCAIPTPCFCGSLSLPVPDKSTYMSRPFSTQGLEKVRIALDKSFNTHVSSPVLWLTRLRFNLGNVASKDLSYRANRRSMLFRGLQQCLMWFLQLLDTFGLTEDYDYY
jgi:hypothetical protein